MVPLDSWKVWKRDMDGKAARCLDPEELASFRTIPKGSAESQLQDLLEQPIKAFSLVNEVFFRSKWIEVFDSILCKDAFTLLEIASGDADMIPRAMARAFPGSEYIAANMNQALTRSMLRKLAEIPLTGRLIDGDAIRIGDHLAKDSVDMVAFQHGVNDVLQAILCQRDGIDTVGGDWMDILPRMIDILKGEVRRGTFETSTKEKFLALVKALLPVLKRGGLIAISHYQFQLDLDWGYPPRLFEGMVPVVRKWMGEISSLQEVRNDGFEPNWWLFYRKESTGAQSSHP